MLGESSAKPKSQPVMKWSKTNKREKQGNSKRLIIKIQFGAK
jgi:hypothetical protein